MGFMLAILVCDFRHEILLSPDFVNSTEEWWLENKTYFASERESRAKGLLAYSRQGIVIKVCFLVCEFVGVYYTNHR